MPILVCGLNHKTAPLNIREAAACGPEKTAKLLQNLLAQKAANEGVLLSTCNRTELYVHTENVAEFNQWFFQQGEICTPHMSQHWYQHFDIAAVRHLMRVASGLDSMALGESQILAQLKEAYRLARHINTMGQQLERLLQNVFSVTKYIRHTTGIGTQSVSIAYMAVKLVKQIFANLSRCRVLVIGAGQTAELTVMHLLSSGVKQITIANRSIDHAQEMAQKYQARAIPLSDISQILHENDIVIAATSSELPLIGKGLVERVLKMRKHKPMFMLDLSVPRNIENEIGQLEDVYLYNLDDMQKLTDENQKSRLQAAEQAEALVNIQADYFMRELRSQSAVDLICAYRDKITDLQEVELQKALEALQRGEVPQDVLKMMSQSLINKIMHDPSAQLKKAAREGQLETLIFAKEIFNL